MRAPNHSDRTWRPVLNNHLERVRLTEEKRNSLQHLTSDPPTYFLTRGPYRWARRTTLAPILLVLWPCEAKTLGVIKASGFWNKKVSEQCLKHLRPPIAS